jgi:hypothetical protein
VSGDAKQPTPGNPAPETSQVKVDLKSLLDQDPPVEKDEKPGRHRSLEKTEPALARPPSGDLAAPARPGIASGGADPLSGRDSDLALLRDELERKIRENEAFRQTFEDLRGQMEAMQADFSVRSSEHMLEIRTLKSIVEKDQEETAAVLGELADLKSTNKQLKAQNLSLQYHLNAWGIPVSAGEDSKAIEERAAVEARGFFPSLTPVPGGVDPVPIVLRGELTSFFFPNLLHFLANANLAGVVTVVTESTVTKLYLEKGVLLLAGWNNRDRDLSLHTLLEESGLVSRDALSQYRDRDIYDLELASSLVTEGKVPPAAVQSGLKEHARVILSFLFELKRGVFFFQPGQIPRRRDLQFRLSVMDVLLKTAAEMDEKTREIPAALAKLPVES